MEFWQHDLVTTGLLLALLLVLAEGLAGLLPPLRRLGVPTSILAGVLGLLLGPELMGLLPLSTEVLEAGVYHALGIVFIALSLQSPRRQQGGGAARHSGRSMAFGITFMVALQTVVGLALVMGLGLLGDDVHPGFGLLLPLGFEQGPGQALSVGGAWEQAGMPSGAQVGLIVAAIGFGWSIGAGVPLVAWGRARGWVAAAPTREEAVDDEASEGGEPFPELPPGGLAHLSRQLGAIAAIYALTWGLCLGLSGALVAAGMADIAAMIWGFHFMVGALLAMGLRPLLRRLPGGSPIHSETQARVAALTVDFATVAALAAIQLAVLEAFWLPILLVTTVGGLVTLGTALWLAWRAFPDAPFEHAVLWFGLSTGTMPTGLALLRMIDPELRSPAPLSAVLGSAGAILGVAPILLALHPIAITGWGEGWPGAGWLALGANVAYLGLTVVLWRFMGGLRLGGGAAGPPAPAEEAG